MAERLMAERLMAERLRAERLKVYPTVMVTSKDRVMATVRKLHLHQPMMRKLSVTTSTRWLRE